MQRFTVLILTISVILLVSLLSMPSSRASLVSNSDVYRSQAIERARADSFGALQRSEFRVADARRQFSIREAFIDDLSMTHVRMDQQFQGVKVFEGELITHFDQQGSLTSITGDYFNNIDISTRPELNENEAIIIAADDFKHNLSFSPNAELMILPANGNYLLTYRIELTDIDSDNPAAKVYFISANNGKIVFQYDNLETAAALGSGRSLYLTTTSINTISVKGGFEMRDNTRGGNYTVNMKNRSFNAPVFTDKDNIWGNFLTSDKASAAVDAHVGLQYTWDYYLNVHGRRGIANDGRGAYNRVHFNKNYNNAFWDDYCFCMTYGDGDGIRYSPLVTLDIVAHEMTHGVTSRTAKLTYSGESGGLNEATSDIFATCVEFYTNHEADPGDYLIGEKNTLTGNLYLRNMADPRADGNSIDHYSQYQNGLDVHFSSGLANHLFYLLAEGGTNRTSGLSVTGIGRASAEKIWYRALTNYFTAGTTFAKARTATIHAATDLYGADSIEAATVATAWTACGVE